MAGDCHDFCTFWLVCTAGCGQYRLSIGGVRLVGHPSVVEVLHLPWICLCSFDSVMSVLCFHLSFTKPHVRGTATGHNIHWDIHRFSAALALFATYVGDCLNLILQISCVPAVFHVWAHRSLVPFAGCFCRQSDLFTECAFIEVLRIGQSTFMPVSIRMLAHLKLIDDSFETFRS